MTAVWLIIPAHGRPQVSDVAFTGIAWALSQLAQAGITANALVIADDSNLDLAAQHRFATLQRPNQPLGRKWNDGIQHACEHGATHVMSCGSDDWVHPDLIQAHLAAPTSGNRVLCSRLSTVISPTGHEATTLRVNYDSGDGIRVLPRNVLEQLRLRPYADDRDRALDGSMLEQCRGLGITWHYTDLHPLQIIDFKTSVNLTPYERLQRSEHTTGTITDPLARLAQHYPHHLIEKAQALYQ